MWRRLVSLSIALVGCKEPNPDKFCDEGSCNNPAFPFCDVSGAVSGEAGTCISASCTANELVECRDDVEVRCNPDGTNYNLVPCDLGCDATADGCRLCAPSETACTNGQLATCDASGAVVSKTECPLGCFEDEPRCRDVAPSNGLAAFADMVADPPDLNLTGGHWYISTSLGEIQNRNTNQTITAPSFLVPAQAGGAPIRVFVAGRVTLGDVLVEGNGQALAVVAREEILVEGPVQLSPGVGGVNLAGCSGTAGYVAREDPNQCLVSGTGGGAHATNGANGGGVENKINGGSGGSASGTETLVPLRGGCSSGGYETEIGFTAPGIPGGGAIQLTSARSIRIIGTIQADGNTFSIYDDVGPMDCGVGVYGGSGGGGILLEAPEVALEATAQLLARGGQGFQAAATAGPYEAAGGAGATRTSAAMAGGTSSYVTTSGFQFHGGGGGGGLGRIRINTVDGAYTKSTASVEDAALTAGVLSTR